MNGCQMKWSVLQVRGLTVRHKMLLIFFVFTDRITKLFEKTLPNSKSGGSNRQYDGDEVCILAPVK